MGFIRKTAIVLLVIMALAVNAQAAQVAALAKGSMSYLGTGGVSAPAEIAATVTIGGVGSMVKKWVPLLVPQTRCAKIVSTLAVVGASSAIGYLTSHYQPWLQANNWSEDENGNLVQTDTLNQPDDESYAAIPTAMFNYYKNNPNECPNGSYTHTAFTSWLEAKANAQALYYTIQEPPDQTTMNDQDINADWGQWVVFWTNNNGTKDRWFNFPYPKTGGATQTETETVTPTIPAYIENKANAAITAGDPNVEEALMASLSVLSDSLDDVGHSLNDLAEAQTAKNELDASITQAQIDSLTGEYADQQSWAEAQGAGEVTVNGLKESDVRNAVIDALTAKGLSKTDVQAAFEAAIQAKADVFGGTAGGLTYAQYVAAVVEALSAQGITGAGIETAVQDAIEAVQTQTETDIGNLTLADTPAPTEPGDLPEKTLITTILQTFMGQLETLPVFSMLSELELEASGSSVISVSIPGFLGGDSSVINIDFSQWQDTFTFMGNLLLAIVGIRWTLYLFEG
ncbi:MAG: DAK2 domain-containing protein [Deltaproteobacteria bacterium]|nr:DAK2 domain-containing protein [Deltaproteobacteria bacterium]